MSLKKFKPRSPILTLRRTVIRTQSSSTVERLMFITRILHPSACASCRLRASIAAKQLARSRKVDVRRLLTTTSRFRKEDRNRLRSISQQSTNGAAADDAVKKQTAEEAALQARRLYGDSLPDGHLNEEELKVYQRLYGAPSVYQDQTEFLQDLIDQDEGVESGTGVLREAEDGELEEVQFDVEELEQDEDIDEEDGGAEVVGQEVDEDVDADGRLGADADLSSAAFDPEASLQEGEDESYQRAHPLTLATRFTTSPSTLPLPKISLIDPIEAQVEHYSNTHLKDAAHRLFGGIGLPYSTSTPNLAKTMQARPIPLDAGQSQMTEMEASTFLTTLYPGIYASVMSALVETRKRLGSDWATGLVEKAQRGELRILDAGGGGAGILAVRELLRAEWERILESDPLTTSSMALAEADGRTGAAGASPPMGHATVLTGSDTLRRRASGLLENTAFIPRLPNYLHTQEVKKEGKFDLIIAPHSLWGLREDWARRAHTQNLWNLLKHDGGVLLLLEKGVPRGFECIADARQLLLDSCISSPTHPSSLPEADDRREDGTIIAPCTNHSTCPMYPSGLQGMLKGRRDICHFSQRYVRPPFLQKILGAKDKNFEDVKFSYLAVMRGLSAGGKVVGVMQDETATRRAFEGYESLDPAMIEEEERRMLALSLPRTILPPLKRKGHVILDVCTPSGTLERWTVPRSFSKQAFRDARKSSWGDLWPLGAKTRVLRTPRGRKIRDGDEGEIQIRADMTVKAVSGKRTPPKGKGRKNVKRKGVKEGRKGVEVD